MYEEVSTFIKINLWLVAGSVASALMLLPEQLRERLIRLMPAILAEFELGIRVIDFAKGGPDNFLVRLSISITCLIVFGLFQFYERDYSQFIPSHLLFKVNFNTYRIHEELRKFTQQDFASVRMYIPEDWESQRNEYFDDRNTQITKLAPTCDFRFSSDSDGDGYFSFNILKRRGNPQTYEADRTSFGIVDFNYNHKGGDDVVMARFELIRDGFEDFNVGLGEILLQPGRPFSLRRYTVIRPRLSQTAYINLTTRERIGSVIALTRVQYFPLVSLSSTLYLVEGAGEFKHGAKQEGATPLTADTTSKEITDKYLTPMIPIACATYLN